MQWFDAALAPPDALSRFPVMSLPPPDRPDAHTPAGVFLGDMAVSEVTVRLRAAGLDVRTQARCSQRLVAAGSSGVRAAGSSGGVPRAALRRPCPQGMCAVVQGGQVVVRQEGGAARSRLVVEGCVTPLYYQVREIVYAQYRLVA